MTSNVQWSCDMVESLSKLASLAPKGLPYENAIPYLREGRATFPNIIIFLFVVVTLWIHIKKNYLLVATNDINKY